MALRMSVQALGDRVYFWTFTLPGRVSIPDACRSWSHLSATLVRRLGFRGVRVFELHPGGHGLHVHVCTDRFYHVSAVRPILRECGWGFGRGVDVQVVRGEAAVGYVSKYCTKASRAAALRGRRLWSSVGGVVGVRCRDLVCDSPVHRLYRSLSRVVINAALLALRRFRPFIHDRAKEAFIRWKCAEYFHAKCFDASDIDDPGAAMVAFSEAWARS